MVNKYSLIFRFNNKYLMYVSYIQDNLEEVIDTSQIIYSQVEKKEHLRWKLYFLSKKWCLNFWVI